MVSSPLRFFVGKMGVTEVLDKKKRGANTQCHLVKNISFVKKAINYDSLFCVMRYVSHYIKLLRFCSI